MLQISGDEIELISDRDQYQFVQRAKRVSFNFFSFLYFFCIYKFTFQKGGLCQILGSRYHVAEEARELVEMISPSLEVTHRFCHLHLS